jgi:hypothetical protein
MSEMPVMRVPLPQRHDDVVREHSHHHHNAELDGQRLLQQLVARRPAEDVADDGSDAQQRQQHQRRNGEGRAVQLRFRLLGDHVERRAEEAHEHPHHQQVRVDDLGHVEGQHRQQRVGPEVLRSGEEAEHELQPEQHHRHREEPVCDVLCPVSHGSRPFLSAVS